MVSATDEELMAADTADDNAQYRRSLVRVAALAVAAVEALDRQTARQVSP